MRSAATACAGSTRARAFSMIELLVVMAIIAVLAALSVAAIGTLRTRTKVADTGRRIDAILSALTEYRANESGPFGAILESTGEGVRRYRRDTTAGSVPDVGGWMSYSDPSSAGAPAWKFRFPLGRERCYFEPRANPPYGNPRPRMPLEIGSDRLNPAFTVEILQIAGTVPVTGSPSGAAAYAGSRRPGDPWNDAWGSPLVIGVGIYQYGPALVSGSVKDPAYAPGTDGEADGGVLTNAHFHRQREIATDFYGYGQSAYVSVGAPGPLPSDPSADLASDLQGTLTSLWRHVNDVCNRDDAGTTLWRVDGTLNAFRTPPWAGTRSVTGTSTIYPGASRRAALSSPVEFK